MSSFLRSFNGYLSKTSGDLIEFYGLSTSVGYLIPDLLYTYILNTYDLIRLGFMAYQLL